MRRFIVSLVLIIALGIGLSGCSGGSGGTSADPLGTDSLIFGYNDPEKPDVWTMEMTVDSSSTVVLTAKITSEVGNGVAGREVSFSFVQNQSGARLSRKHANTDASGKAVIIYTSGTTGGFDRVKARISNGTSLEVNIKVNPTVTGMRISLVADRTLLAAGESTILSATVTNGAGNPVSHQAVSFSFFTGGNNSGASLTPLGGGVTDISGRAIAVYTAGNSSSTDTVTDIIQATVGALTSPAAVIMTRVGLSSTSKRIDLTASTTTLAAGGSSVLTATVTDAYGNPVSGQTVLFALTVTNTGAGASLTPSSAKTDSSGRAISIYTSGSGSLNEIRQDVAEASIADGSTAAVIMTRTAGAGGPTGHRITVNAVPTSVTENGSSVIIALVQDASGAPVSGVTVTYGFVANNSDAAITPLNSVTPTTNQTDADGTAIAVYTAGSDSPEISVQDAVSASISDSAGAVIITRLTGAGTGNRLKSLTEDPETTALLPLLTTSSNCILTATVTRDDGTTPVAGIPVTFSIVTGFTGTLSPILGGTLSSTQVVTTDNNGQAQVLFTGPGGLGPGETVVEASISGTANVGSAARIIYW